jgi:phosphoserine phosphatase RsbU/P
MEIMTNSFAREHSFAREQLMDRRRKLDYARHTAPHDGDLTRLMAEVDAALARVETESYGLCEACQGVIESERLMADPLSRLCLECLTPTEQRALEDDLTLAARIQGELLPRRDYRIDGWEVAYHYQPVRLVSGDYCDLITAENGDLYFIVGDVSGKGVAASMLMAHLHALFRSLVPAGLPLPLLLERVSRVFCESTLPSHYATLVCARASREGRVELANAGHPPPLVVSGEAVTLVAPTGLPLGVFRDQRFASSEVGLGPGDTLMIYTDGVSEAENAAGDEFGADRVIALARANQALSATALVRHCVSEVGDFCSHAHADDLTVMAIRRSGGVRS